MKLIKKCFFFSTIFLIAIIFVSCDMFGDVSSASDGGSINGNQGGTPGINTGEQTESYTSSTTIRDITADSYDSMPEFAETVTVNLSDASTTCNSSNCTITTTSDLVTITYSGSDSVQFNISGTLSSHGLFISYESKKKAIGLNLSDVSITSLDTPCIYTEVKKTQPLYICLNGTNTLTDGRTYGTGYGSDFSAAGNDSKGTVYSKGSIIISGTGSLKVTENYKHGIASKDYIKVNSGTITINSTGRNGFQAVNGFVMNDGTVTINGTGTNTNNQSRGIVVEGSDEYDTKEETSYEYPGEGFIVINGGSLNITTVSKAITAKWDIEEDADTTDDTTDDPYPYVKITGGNITIKTTGTPTEGRYGNVTDADGVTANEEIKLAPEGIEGKQAVFISGGTISLNCTDDCINSSRDGSSKIEISGGNIYAVSTTNDAIDSNGSLTISGGNVVAIATNNPECAFDCDQYTFAITGGNVAGIGTSNYSEPTSSACKQGVLVLASSYLGSAGKTIAVKDSSGDIVYAFTIPSGTSLNGCVGIFSCPSFTNSGSYSLIKGATASSGSAYYGLYTSMPTITGGTSYSGISFSGNYVYTAGSTGNQGAHEGPRQ